MSIDAIALHSGHHAIEVENFAVSFRSQLDLGDKSRFNERRDSLTNHFGAIEEPEVFQFTVGPTPEFRSNQPEPVMFALTEFGRDGKATWTGQFGENATAVSARQYSNWQEIWPQVVLKLGELLQCIDPHKMVASVEYSVTDSFSERYNRGGTQALNPSNIFKFGAWVPMRLENYRDPRWDFQSGLFVDNQAEFDVLERVEAKSVIRDKRVIASITNSFSYKFKKPIRLKDIQGSSDTLSDEISVIFTKFHDDNKSSIRSILVEGMLQRMGLE